MNVPCAIQCYEMLGMLDALHSNNLLINSGCAHVLTDLQKLQDVFATEIQYTSLIVLWHTYTMSDILCLAIQHVLTLSKSSAFTARPTMVAEGLICQCRESCRSAPYCLVGS